MQVNAASAVLAFDSIPAFEGVAIMSTNRTVWFLVADSARARILSTDRIGSHFETVASFESEDAHKPSHELGSDKPGRAFERGIPSRSAMEPHTAPQRVAKQQFDRDVAQALNQAAGQNQFDALVLVAPPRTLGDLRRHLDDSARDRVSEEVGKDLVKLPEPDLQVQLRDLLRPH
jgi:protein required for attachment to host cells